ncbi:MAG: beta-ketoacyl synthase chain length factor [Methylophilaceae bacterium]
MRSLSESTLTAYIDGIGLIGPGLTSWHDSQNLLTENAAYQTAPTIFPTPMLLAAAERRRSGDLVRLTLAVGLEAAQHAGLDAANLTCVYTSSNGDGKNCHEICKTLASGDRQISPTRFHNSVHNAAAGYWSIATGAKTSISVLCAFDASFGAGLLETASQVITDDIPTLLIACDTPYPDPLNGVRPISGAMGVAMVMSPKASDHTLARVDIKLTDSRPDQLMHTELERLRTAIPAARSLPLLVAIAQRKSTAVVLDYLEDLGISIEVMPC